ncbi:terminase [Tersicoccus sp. Bi-70]|uniref:terminase n=1 Tax=Tersicoccus sp. Bi-70 TaxID=1897634 RepID=UPI001181478F|nr:terminase [Tersicoccus sp. Bi-70]
MLVDTGPGTLYYETVHDGDVALTDTGTRYGCAEPRLSTPPLRPLTPETSMGFSVIEFATNILRVTLMPWQRALLIRMLELRPDGGLRFATVVVLVARQNGKSTLSQVLALWFMLVAGWPLVLGTAQDLETAEEVWEGAVSLLEDSDDEDDDDDSLADLISRVVKVNGKKSLILTNGTRYKVKAANRRAGRGFSGNLVLLDELREHQNWLAWGAITKTTQAQVFSLILALSNAGDLTSVVLRYLRKMAHKAIGDPDGICKDDDDLGPTQLDLEDDGDEGDSADDWAQDGESLAVFEWSAAPGLSKWDRDGWAQGNPALGYRIKERKIASDCRIDPEWVFRTEVLCQWSDGVVDGPFPPGSWEKGVNETTEGPDDKLVLKNDADRIVGDVWACVDTAHDREQTYIAFAGRRADGAAQVEVVAGRYGQDWVKAWLMDDKRRGRIKAVTGQTRGAPVSSLMSNMAEDVAFTIPVREWAGSDIMGAFGDLFDAVRDVKVKHNPQGPLDAAAKVAVTKALGDGKALDRQHSPTDIAPLVAFEGALWLLLKYKPPPPPASAPPMAVTTDDDDDEYGTADLMTMGF